MEDLGFRRVVCVQGWFEWCGWCVLRVLLYVNVVGDLWLRCGYGLDLLCAASGV